MQSKTFEQRVMDFNKMYGLDAHTVPTLPPSRKLLIEKLQKFRLILAEELDEVDEIITKIDDGYPSPLDALTDIADWLGDIQVYCASEMRKYGLSNDVVIGIIMASNMSKRGEDGKPIYDERGKVMKGPNYFRPEAQIKRYIQAEARTALKGEAS